MSQNLDIERELTTVGLEPRILTLAVTELTKGITDLPLYLDTLLKFLETGIAHGLSEHEVRAPVEIGIEEALQRAQDGFYRIGYRLGTYFNRVKADETTITAVLNYAMKHISEPIIGLEKTEQAARKFDTAFWGNQRH